ncbi:MAG: homogentisate 1,2-dioxygenase [Candidatus Marinimicrobia bacterium]|nr:homogentisate 1,2-dioxygenase [Candidatus Neomarinimicrobiota bacterium]
MPFYRQQGNIPPKRHTVFRSESNKLYFEELVSREGFNSLSSNIYHHQMPSVLVGTEGFTPVQTNSHSLGHGNQHIFTARLNSSGDCISARSLLFYNVDLLVHKAHVDSSMEFLYRNGHFDELIYVQSGNGSLLTNFGNLKFSSGDYIIIPRGVIWKMEINEKTKLLIVESTGAIETPSKYRNRFGQLMEHSPYCERDIRTPILGNPMNGQGEYVVKVRLTNGIQDMLYGAHPFDVVGWDGYYYPWIINIRDFEPVVGSIHQPPPVHQMFQAAGFVVCSFVDRLFDFHPNAIPAPYYHSNVDSDELIFYSKGNFMSRKGIEEESMTYHPMGLPHGPQPGKYEGSIGVKSTEEQAVMIDTFKPLQLAADVASILDETYPDSWNSN